MLGPPIKIIETALLPVNSCRKPFRAEIIYIIHTAAAAAFVRHFILGSSGRRVHGTIILIRLCVLLHCVRLSRSVPKKLPWLPRSYIMI